MRVSLTAGALAPASPPVAMLVPKVLLTPRAEPGSPRPLPHRRLPPFPAASGKPPLRAPAGAAPPEPRSSPGAKGGEGGPARRGLDGAAGAGSSLRAAGGGCLERGVFVRG